MTLYVLMICHVLNRGHNYKVIVLVFSGNMSYE